MPHTHTLFKDRDHNRTEGGQLCFSCVVKAQLKVLHRIGDGQLLGLGRSQREAEHMQA
jgi:hypothetical protein